MHQAKPAMTESATPDANWQCWECRRRRLVCDSTRPICKKCRVAGIVCPGYEDVKPLTWLAPGRVVSRARTRKRKGSDPPIDDEPKSATTRQPQLSSRLELRTETCDIVEALAYYNTRLYPDALAHQLGPTPFIIPLPTLPALPPSIVHALVSMAIGHRLIQSSADASGSASQSEIWERFYHHRGIAIRAVNDMIRDEKQRSSLMAIASVYILLFAVIQQSTAPVWRPHVDGLMTLIKLRGPFATIARSTSDMRLTMHALLVVGTLANSTSPPSDQFLPCSRQDCDLLFLEVSDLFYYPTAPCPTFLLLNITMINDLRLRAVSAHPDIAPQLAAEAFQVLDDIGRFSPDDWAAARTELQGTWELLARTFRSAVALYAILALQSVSLLAASHETADVEKQHFRQLVLLLREARAIPHTRMCVVWPLVVAGVCAAKAGAGARSWIENELLLCSRELGTACQLVARTVLQKFWASGKVRWDDCFDKPYMLVA